MRSPRRGLEQLDFLGHYQWPELRGETLYEILVRKHRCPMRAPVGVVLELPQMYKLVDRPSVGLEVADEVLVVASLLECREAEFLVELHRLGAYTSSTRTGPLGVSSIRTASSRYEWDIIPEYQRGDATLIAMDGRRH